MLHSDRQPEYDKPHNYPIQLPNILEAQLHHLRRFGCYGSQLIPKKQRTDNKNGARSKAGMMVGYVHNSTTLWRIWDPEHSMVKAQSDVIFDEDRNAYIS
jgi:carboxylesterase type B